MSEEKTLPGKERKTYLKKEVKFACVKYVKIVTCSFEVFKKLCCVVCVRVFDLLV